MNETKDQKKQANRTYTERIAARVTDTQLEHMRRAAKRAGLDLATWARVVLVAAVTLPADNICGQTMRGNLAGQAKAES